MAKIETNTPLQSVKGEIIKNEKGEPITCGDQISDILSAERSAYLRPVRAFMLAQKFAAGVVIELDQDDLSNLKKTLEENQTRSPLVLAQCISLLDKSSEKE